jgi:hypothetical protein
MDVEFVGFAEGCCVTGKVGLGDARLADLLNRQRTIIVNDAVVVRTLDGHIDNFEQLEIGCDELAIVVANGPSGDPRRRLPTTAECVTLHLGPYSAEGFVHAPLTEIADAGLEDAPAMVALTDAWLEYQFRDEPRSEWFRTLLVNRAMAISLRTVGGPGDQSAEIDASA